MIRPIKLGPAILAHMLRDAEGCTMDDAVRAVSEFMQRTRDEAQPPATLRDQFAAAVLQSSFQQRMDFATQAANVSVATAREMIAKSCYEMADAMLVARLSKAAA
jgi:hypothetical protein